MKPAITRIYELDLLASDGTQDHLGVAGEYMLNQGGPVQAFVHPSSPRRSEFGSWDGTLSEFGLKLLEETEDFVHDEGVRVVRPDHKIGGRPHLIRETVELVKWVNWQMSKGALSLSSLIFLLERMRLSLKAGHLRTEYFHCSAGRRSARRIGAGTGILSSQEVSLSNVGFDLKSPI